MGTLINFLIDNYIYVVFVSILLVLALIGYIVDNTKTNKLKAESAKPEKDAELDIPATTLNANITLGETVNKMAMNNTQSVNIETGDNPLNVGK